MKITESVVNFSNTNYVHARYAYICVNFFSPYLIKDIIILERVRR